MPAAPPASAPWRAFVEAALDDAVAAAHVSLALLADAAPLELVGALHERTRDALEAALAVAAAVDGAATPRAPDRAPVDRVTPADRTALADRIASERAAPAAARASAARAAAMSVDDVAGTVLRAAASSLLAQADAWSDVVAWCRGDAAAAPRASPAPASITRDGNDAALASVAATLGAAAADALAAALATAADEAFGDEAFGDDGGPLRPHAFGSVVVVSGEEIGFGEPTPYVWIRTGAGTWTRSRGLKALEPALQGAAVDIVREATAVADLAAFLGEGSVIRSRADALLLTRDRGLAIDDDDDDEDGDGVIPERALPASSLALVEPPHFEAAALVLCVNDSSAGILWRVVIERESLQVTTTRLGHGYRRAQAEGRAYRDAEGRNLLPRFDGVVERGAWWFDSARAEHASIASFARNVLELVDVAAPWSLVARSHRAAADEARHAASAYRLAGQLEGRALTGGSLAALPPRSADLARFTVDTLFEAALPETLSSTIALHACGTAPRAAVAFHLGMISADEKEHAVLAWDTLEWCASMPAGRAALDGMTIAAPVPEPFEGLSADEVLAAAHAAWTLVALPMLAQLGVRTR